MAQTIKLKRSAVAGGAPTTSQLELGEVAINTYDGKMYIKKSVAGTESIVEISGGDSGTGIIDEFLYTATAGQTAFSGNDDNSDFLSYVIGAIQVFLNGILLDPETDYTATNGALITLVSAAAVNDYIQIFSFKKKISDGNVTVDSFSGNNSTTAFTLSIDPGDENNTRVFVDGVYQSKANYTVSGTTLTFSTAPPSGTAIEVESGNRSVTLPTTENLDFPDNVKLRLGTSQDLEIYHDASDSLINDNGTGSLKLQTGGATKLEVTSTGVDVTGNITVSGTVDGVDIAARDAVLTSTTTTAGAALPKAGGAMTGAITTNSTFDGRDIAADGTKLDTIETSATADQTQSEINALGITATGLSGTPNIAVGTVSSGNITTTGELRGPASLVIDPAAVGDNTGTVVIKGNLQVDGATTTINSTTLTVDDLNLTLASGAANGTAANGAGITIDGASATLTYQSTGDNWAFNKNLDVTGNIAVSGTVDGVDIAARDAVLTSTTTTANAALPLTGGTITGTGTTALTIVNSGLGGYLNVGSNVGGVATNGNVGLHIGWNKSNGGREVNMIFDGGTTQADAEMIFTSTDGTTYTDIFQINGAVGTGVDIKSGGLRIGTTTVIDANRDITVNENISSSTGNPLVLAGDGGANIELYGNGNAYFDATQLHLRSTNGGGGGALAIAGTTVIDGSRNLTHIGTISSGAITSTGNLTIGDGTQALNGDGILTIRKGNAFAGLDFKSARTAGNIGGTRFYNPSSTSVPAAQFLIEVDGSYNFYNGTNGAQNRLKIDTSGNVGIGTTSPLAKLHVQGNAVIGNIQPYETTDPSNSGATLHVHNLAGDGADSDGKVNFGDETQVIISTGAIDGGPQGYQGSLWFGTSDHPAGGNTLNSSGTQWNWKVAGIASKTEQDTASTNASFGNLEFYTKGLNNTPDAALAMTIDESQNVGIGTSSPDTSLHIVKNQSSANSSIKLENAAGGNNSSFSIDWQLAFSGTSAQIKADRTNSPGAGDTDLIFSTSTTGTTLSEAMRIDSAGSIIQGNSGTHSWTANNNTLFAAGGIGVTSNSDWCLQLAGSTAERIRFFTSAGGSSTVGNISVNTAGTTYSTTSDVRLKKNIKTITDGTDKLMSMNPVTHGWKSDPEADTVHGFIAQEMMNIVPEAVSGDPEGEEMMSMDYGRITPVIVAALQDALKEIKELTTRIDKLERK